MGLRSASDCQSICTLNNDQRAWESSSSWLDVIWMEMTASQDTALYWWLRVQDCSWWRHQIEKKKSALLAFVRGFTGHWWIPLTKASDAELWCFIWSAPEQTIEYIVGDLRRHRAHYDVTVISTQMQKIKIKTKITIQFQFNLAPTPGHWNRMAKLIWLGNLYTVISMLLMGFAELCTQGHFNFRKRNILFEKKPKLRLFAEMK